ncbi:MAG: phosphotransferase [Methylococcales bacterium]|nr:phosphotransferase [Methylococcales bacterium]
MTTSRASRQHALQHWLSTHTSVASETLTALGGDASFRRYYRFQAQQQSWLVMDAPPEHEDLARFLDRAQLFAHLQVPVPRCYEFDLQQGFLLLEDFGQHSLESVLTAANADTWYARAMRQLLDWQQQTLAQPLSVPDYDEALLQRELDLFEQWFIRRHLRLDEPVPGFAEVCAKLIEAALAQPKVLVHRDYHCRNLMVVGSQLGVIDFQDAVTGPVTYDLVSLLRDCYQHWPDSAVDTWLERYYQQALGLGLVDCDRACFRQWFDWMGLQRQLKVLGIFARLYWRDDKPGYLAVLPHVLDSVCRVCACYPQWASFYEFLEYKVRPALAQARVEP